MRRKRGEFTTGDLCLSKVVRVYLPILPRPMIPIRTLFNDIQDLEWPTNYRIAGPAEQA